MRQVLSKIAKSFTHLWQRPSAKGIWCVVANVANEHPSGPGGVEVERGTKHFRPRTLVYCPTVLWGDGYEKTRVVGRHRGSNRYGTMVVRAAWLTNWRVKLVFSPHVMAEFHKMGATWDGFRHSKREAEKIVAWMRGEPPSSVSES